jgi:hypothetical protein
MPKKICRMPNFMRPDVKSPRLCPPFHPLSLVQWYPQSNETLLNLSMNSAFHTQGSRVIIVVVQVGAMKIYVGAVESLRGKKER